jgi:signal transduction histidine kinase
VLAAVILVNLVALAISTFSSSDQATEERDVFTSAQTTASSIIFTQRESLAYTTRYSMWLAGLVTKREVEISRAILAQRLNVIDIENLSMGARLDPEFIDALRLSDKLLAMSPDGVLPRTDVAPIKMQAQEFITTILGASRTLVVAYQQELDAHLVAVAEKRQAESLRNLALLISLMILTSIFIGWSGIRFVRQVKRTQIYIDSEILALEVARKELLKMNLTVSSLEELNDSKNDFISTVNHELRTPLTSIIGYIELLKSEIELGKDPQIDLIVDVVDKNALVLLDLVESILSLSRLDSKQNKPLFEEVNLINTVEKAIFVLTPQADLNHVDIKLAFNQDNDYLVMGDPNQLSQVFLNLISNAVKFSPEKSEILITFSRVLNDQMENHISVSIIDNGIGIPEKEIPELFHRFFRASNAINKQIVGTGLGLAIVSKIIEIHKGKISVSSQENKGSTFRVEIPAFVSALDQRILDKRVEVLERAIVAIRNAEISKLKDVYHEMGGALGIYGLDELGSQVLELSRTLAARKIDEATVADQRVSLLETLNTTYQRLNNKGNI